MLICIELDQIKTNPTSSSTRSDAKTQMGPSPFVTPFPTPSLLLLPSTLSPPQEPKLRVYACLRQKTDGQTLL